MGIECLIGVKEPRMGESLLANRVFWCPWETVRVCSRMREAVLVWILDISGHTSSMRSRAVVLAWCGFSVMMCSGMPSG
jgi:hypothetical protein